MKRSITHKIIDSHLIEGRMIQGEEISIRIDQTLTHDVTGTMAYLAFEALNIPRVKTDISVSYLDHNLLQVDNKNMDDHLFFQSTAKKFGLHCSRPGNGICHMLQYSRFGIPGKTLIGSDSHTTTGGAIGMLCIGSGGMDVAMSMAGEPFSFRMPKVVNVILEGELRGGVSAKDVILEILRMISVKGGLGKVFEYTGPGVKTLSVPERATIANMGAEAGATTSIFPSDEIVRDFFKAQKREKDWVEFLPDEGAEYDETMVIDLSTLEPLVAQPDMPDNVIEASKLSGVKVNQVYIGSCTNSSYSDMVKVARILESKVVHPDVSLVVSAGTKYILEMMIRDGVLQILVSSGARILECGCGPCTGIGQAPSTGGVSVRTSNRNFKGRGGTLDSKLYITSPEVAAATAITGYITDPKEIIDINLLKGIHEPNDYVVDDRMFILPIEDGSSVEIVRGPNIKPLPINDVLGDEISAKVVIKTGDNITTDDIIPASANFSALRSNIPAIAEITFSRIDNEFVKRAKEYKSSIIVGGENYGQGSSREHAAITPMYLGVKAVIAKSMARIHKANLINFGVLPLIFENPTDYDKLDRDDQLVITDVINQVKNRKVIVHNLTKGTSIPTVMDTSDKEVELLIAGGKLTYVKNKNKNRLHAEA